VNAILSKIAADYQDTLLGIDIRLAQSTALQLWTRLNPQSLHRALLNLIMNSRDAMPPRGGLITLSAHLQDEGRMVCLHVADNGLGMDEETCARCFEPGFTTKGEHGTGLGLAMVAFFVQEHHGTVSVQSTLGLGTTFELCFPRVDIEAEAA
jgi:signal transduction histidine kinase